MLSMVALLSVVVVVFDVSALTGMAAKHVSAGDLAVPAFFTFAFLWTSYWFIFRVVYMVEARADQLTWRTGLRSRQAPMSEVQSISSPVWLSGAWMIRTQHGRMLMMPNTYALRFADRMRELYPNVDVRLGRFGRTYARIQRPVGPLTRWTSGMFEEGDGA